MSNQLEKYLLEAEGKEQKALPPQNPYREIGFDHGKKRLGWVRALPFSVIEEGIKCLEDILSDKESFIFIGMGGSSNGIKALLPLFKNSSLFILDSLDPRALDEIFAKIKDLNKTLVIPISKSGTTKETHLLTLSLKELFKDKWSRHSLWLTDPNSFDKVDSFGWQGSKKSTIQLDKESDIGGRYSCPQTLIFLLPLFLFLNKNFNKLKNIYESYLSHQEEIRKRAFYFADKYKDATRAYFHPLIEAKSDEGFFSWVVQLFQESLGSKKDGFMVKTLGYFQEPRDGFYPLKLDFPPKADQPQAEKIDDQIVLLMSQMYFFQLFVAYYAAFKGINFVGQDFVEEYKAQMRKLEGSPVEDVKVFKIDELINEAKGRVKESHHFIDIILYFHTGIKDIKLIRNKFKEAFPDKGIFVFIGSDWNHHSYQAAFKDKNTFFLFLLSSTYDTKNLPLSNKTLKKNIYTLKLITKATHLTLKDKSFLSSLRTTD